MKPDPLLEQEAEEIGSLVIATGGRHGDITVRDCVELVFVSVNGVPPREAHNQATWALKNAAEDRRRKTVRDGEGLSADKIASALMPHIVGASSNWCKPEGFCKQPVGECLCRQAAEAAAADLLRALSV